VLPTWLAAALCPEQSAYALRVLGRDHRVATGTIFTSGAPHFIEQAGRTQRAPHAGSAGAHHKIRLDRLIPPKSVLGPSASAAAEPATKPRRLSDVSAASTDGLKLGGRLLVRVLWLHVRMLLLLEKAVAGSSPTSRFATSA
jgi:hypothetical protein